MEEQIIRLRKGKSGRIKPGHPWIYKSQILVSGVASRPGDIVTVVTNEGRFIGRGYYNPKSEIAARLLTFGEESIDRKFLENKIRTAAEKRKEILSVTNAYRVVFSEGDSLGGLIVDVYADTAVFQVFTLGMERLKSIIIDVLKDVLKPKYLYERSVSPFRAIEGLKDMKMWIGDKGDPEVEISEGKVKFIVNVESGHKTGFYLDQRRSRMAMEGIVKGKKVLDLFCYTGGFGVSAAAFGAGNVLGVDIKEDWLELARRNAELNGVSDKTRFIAEDAFTALKNFHDSGEKFDIVIVDPPSFLRAKRNVVTAAKGYKEINLGAMNVLGKGGILCTYSCSHNMPNELFSKTLKDAAASSGKSFRILKRCHQAEDHPIVRTIPETEYLKGYFLLT